MTEVQAWTYLVTLGIPVVVALVNRPTWSPALKRWVAIGVAVVVSLVMLWLQGEFDDLVFSNLFAHLVAVVGMAQIWYAAIVAVPAGKRALDRLEAATSPKQPPPPMITENRPQTYGVGGYNATFITPTEPGLPEVLEPPEERE